MKHTIITGSFALMSLGLQAQSNTVSAGGTASGSGGSATYTIGQIDYSNASGSNGSINEGVQQPYEFFRDLGIAEGHQLELSVYPNPATDIIVLELGESQDDLTYLLYDTNGKLIERHPIKSTQTQIDLSELSAGEYHLRIEERSIEIENIKIIKH